MTLLSRRKFCSLSLSVAAGAVTATNFQRLAYAAGTVPTPESLNAAVYQQGIASAIQFQNQMMDAYTTGSTVRLIQSYADQSGLESTAFTYDNAVSIHAYLLHAGTYGWGEGRDALGLSHLT